MSSAKLAIACGFVVVVLSACGTKANPTAGTIPPGAPSAGHAKLDDPRAKHLQCLQQHKVAVTEVGQAGLRIDAPGNPEVQFAATPGAAQWLQIDGQDPGAEVIGSALLYPERASDQLLGTIENCLDQGVKG